MATARSDPLRSTLDNLELDPRSEADRPYLVAMLRRLGYTERDIEEVIRTGRMPAAAPAADDGLAPARDYRIVVPASDTRFALDSTGAAGTDSPFEDLERVEFEDPAQDVEFETVEEGAGETEPAPAEPTWEEAPVEELPLEEQAAAEPAPDGDEALDTAPIDTFGTAGTPGVPKTRVRVRRVRAASKEEAERKVAGSGRSVIKSVPVDIVERWGAGEKGKKGKDPEA
jgi:hypothetical protein